jgi:hypothetical protein
MSKESLSTPESKYDKGWDNSEYRYIPHRLSLIETVYVNTLILRGARTIGFRDLSRITDSIYCIATWDAANREDVCENGIFNLDVFNKRFYESTYVKMAVREHDGCKDIELDLYLMFWDICKAGAMKDILKNRYLIKHLLSNKDMVIREDCFDMFGAPDKRIEVLKKILSDLENE